MNHLQNLPVLHFKPEHYVHYEEYNGTWRKDSWENLRHCPAIKRIQYNTQKYRNYIIIDIDHPNLDIYKYIEVPKPNIIVKNKDGSGAHYFYFLNRPVFYDENEKDIEKRNRQAYYVKKWKHVMKQYSLYFGGDPKSVGYIGKNMFSEHFDVQVLQNEEYSLEALEFYCDEPIEIYERSQERKQKSIYDYSVNDMGTVEIGSRNVSLFNEVRFFAYKEVKKGSRGLDLEFRIALYAKDVNRTFMTPLSDNEVSDTFKSIIKYCNKNRTKIYNSKRRGIMNLDESLTTQEKQKKGAIFSANKNSERTRTQIEITIRDMRRKGLEVSLKGVSRESGISYNTVKKNRDLLTSFSEEKGGVKTVSYQYSLSNEEKREEKKTEEIYPFSFVREAPTLVGATEIENEIKMSSNSQSKSPLVLKIENIPKKVKRERPGESSVKGHLSEDVRNLFSDFLNSG